MATIVLKTGMVAFTVNAIQVLTAQMYQLPVLVLSVENAPRILKVHNQSDELCYNALAFFNALLIFAHFLQTVDFFVISGNGTICTDVNFCLGDPCNQTCTSASTTFVCSCIDGFQLNSTDNTSCSDINECAEGACSDISQSECVNTIGSYR